jgi:hypothetical protein
LVAVKKLFRADSTVFVGQYKQDVTELERRRDEGVIT